MKAKFASGILSGICMVLLASLLGSCTQEKDFYDPDNNPLPNENEYFGFETRKDMNLNVNYNTPVNALIEVYAENPMETNAEGGFVKKEDTKALFKIYTDAEGKFNGKMELPTSLDSVYIYTAAWGLPRSLGAKIENGTVNLNLVPAATKAAVTRGYDFGAKCPYLVNAAEKLYSLAPWSSYGALDSYTDASGSHKYITGTSTIGEETVDEFATRLMDRLTGSGNPTQDNSSLVQGEGSANLKLTKEAEVKVAFVNRDASFDNTFGYYYYDGTGSNRDPKQLRKYIIFPNVAMAVSTASGETRQILKLGDKVQLKYFGPDGNSEPVDKFPANTVIGWFIYPNGYIKPDYAAGGFSDTIFPTLLVSSDKVNSDTKKYSFITVLDKKTNKYIIGVEDGVNNSYCDLLFYAEATPGDAIEGGHPEIEPPVEKPEKPDAVETKTGTLAFEDIWPTGGDYDMNDFIVEYRHELTFDKDNRVKKIVHQFKPVYKNAGLVNTFAFQIDPSEPMGWVEVLDGITVEKETNSFLVCQGLDANMGKTFTVTRDFMQGDIPPVRKDEMKKYNPYLIAGYKGETPRIEVHLPKHNPTSKVNTALIGTGDDAFYVDKKGLYPFAIDIPITGFSQEAEKTPISDVYPDFGKWVESKGEEATDWYNNKGK